MKNRPLSCLFLVIAGMADARASAFGELPSGALSTNVVTEVAAEICRDHIFDPAKATLAMPKGYQLVRLSEYSQGDPDAARLLKQNAALANHAMGSLCFMSVGKFVVDDKTIKPSPMPMAFWWARATGPRDERMRGKVEWVQLASWYPSAASHREAVLATDPMAQFVDIKVERVSPGKWRLRLSLAKEFIEAEVETSGEPKRRKSTEPGFMTVPFSGDSADRFWVITYHSHHHQTAMGRWRSSGTGVFSDALSIPGESGAFTTLFQNGWSALSGVYKSP